MIDKTPLDHPTRKPRSYRTCGEFKQPKEFPCYRHKQSYGGYQAHNSCISCEKDRKLRQHLKKSYDMTLEEYEGMVLEQDNKYYLCGEEPSDVYGKLVIDHCHKTGKVRKLLCRSCNVFLAKIESCPEYFKKVTAYLKEI